MSRDTFQVGEPAIGPVTHHGHRREEGGEVLKNLPALKKEKDKGVDDELIEVEVMYGALTTHTHISLTSMCYVKNSMINVDACPWALSEI